MTFLSDVMGSRVNRRRSHWGRSRSAPCRFGKSTPRIPFGTRAWLVLWLTLFMVLQHVLRRHPHNVSRFLIVLFLKHIFVVFFFIRCYMLTALAVNVCAPRGGVLDARPPICEGVCSGPFMHAPTCVVVLCAGLFLIYLFIFAPVKVGLFAIH